MVGHSVTISFGHGEEKKQLGIKLDGNPGDTVSRKRLVEIMREERDPDVDVQEWMLKEERYPLYLPTSSGLEGNHYCLGGSHGEFDSGWKKNSVDKSVFDFLTYDHKMSENHPWRYYKTRTGAEKALGEALVKAGVLPIPAKPHWIAEGMASHPVVKETVECVKPIDEGFFSIPLPGEKEIKKTSPSREKELQEKLDRDPRDWAARMELGDLLQSKDNKAAAIQWWMAENQKCPLPTGGIWWLAEGAHLQIAAWKDRDTMTPCYLHMSHLEKLSKPWWHCSSPWKGYTSRALAEKDMEALVS